MLNAINQAVNLYGGTLGGCTVLTTGATSQFNTFIYTRTHVLPSQRWRGRGSARAFGGNWSAATDKKIPIPFKAETAYILSCAGLSNVSFVGKSLYRGVLSSSNAGTLTGQSRSKSSSVLSVACIATLSGQAQAKARVALTAAGLGSLAGVGDFVDGGGGGPVVVSTYAPVFRPRRR